MKKIFFCSKGILLLPAILFLTLSIRAQMPVGTAVQDIKYKFMQSTGTNASAVVWVPTKQLYVTVIAGSISFPLEGFNARGQNVFAEEADMDVRGMWFNPASAKIEVNCAGEIGWKSFSILEGWKPSMRSDLFTGQFQPDFQSVGAYDASKKMVVFLDFESGGLRMYSIKKPSKVKKLALDWSSLSPENLNLYTVGYTGRSGYEYVLLDHVNTNILFFNRKGKLTGTTNLPKDAPVNEAFAFSFTNDRVFLYDKEGRTWYGYKVF